MVLVHGIRSGPDTWVPARSALTQDGVRSFAFQTVSGAGYYDQAVALSSDLSNQGLYGTSPTYVGHSQGGVIARQLSTFQPGAALMTIGSPHLGAPFVVNFNAWINSLTAESLGYDAIIAAVLDSYSFGDDYWSGYGANESYMVEGSVTSGLCVVGDLLAGIADVTRRVPSCSPARRRDPRADIAVRMFGVRRDPARALHRLRPAVFGIDPARAVDA